MKIILKYYLKIIRDRILYLFKAKEFNHLTDEKLTKREGQRIILIGTPNFNNLGDHAIAIAEKSYCTNSFKGAEYIEISLTHYKFNFKRIRTQIDNNDLILIHGGGFLGTLWPDAETIVHHIINTFPENKILIMPQTIYYDNSRFGKFLLRNSKKVYSKHKKLTVALRDNQSYDFFKENFSTVEGILVPDIVTILEKNFNNEREGVIFCFRSDKEKINHEAFIETTIKILAKMRINYFSTDTVIEEFPTEQNRNFYVDKKLIEFSKSELVITDRLHGMLFCLITGTPCIALNNLSGKVRGVFYWFSNINEYNYISSIDLNETNINSDMIESLLIEKLDQKDNTYDNQLLLKKFLPLYKVISENIN